MEAFRVDVTDDDGVVATLKLVGELDAAATDKLRDAANAQMTRGVDRIVLDLSELDFIDSTGLGAMLGVLKRLREKDGELALSAVSPRVQKLLDLTGLDKAFTIV